MLATVQAISGLCVSGLNVLRLSGNVALTKWWKADELGRLGITDVSIKFNCACNTQNYTYYDLLSFEFSSIPRLLNAAAKYNSILHTCACCAYIRRSISQ